MGRMESALSGHPETKLRVGNMKFKWVLLLAFLGVVQLHLQAFANVGEMFGFGSRMTALGGAGVGSGLHPFSAYTNPAGLGADPEGRSEEQKDKRLHLSWGLIYMQPQFTPIQNVVTQNNFNADQAAGKPLSGDVDTSYRSTFGQQIGLSYRLTQASIKPTFGVVAFLPLESAAFMDTGEAYVPEYVLYRARTQRPQVEVATGVQLAKGFQVGAGLRFGFALTSNASIFINTKQNTSSSMRFISSVKPKASPYLGFLYTADAEGSLPAPYSLGAVLRFPMSSDNEMVLKTAARAFGDLAAIDFNFNSLSTLFYDPLSLELGGGWQHASWGRLSAQVDYQVWRAFRPPALKIQQPETTNCDPVGGSSTCSPDTIQIASTSLPGLPLRNILTPRIGEEITVSDLHTLRFGYAYRPSVFQDLPTGFGNYLDPPKHMLNVGWGLNFPRFMGYEIPARLDFHLSYQILVTQHIVKDDSNQIGYSPTGYDAGGKLFGGGLSLGLAF